MGADGPAAQPNGAPDSQGRPCAIWRDAPAHVRLDADGVHLWRIDMNPHRAPLASMTRLLGENERLRAEQVISQDARRRFIVSHTAMRQILSRYLDQPADEIRYTADARGKPVLDRMAGAPDIRFNLSHSGELALLAVALGRDVGVDLELIRPVSAWRIIAGRYFSASENQELAELPAEEAAVAFLRCWTRKEAVAKASGEGISTRWTGLTVSLEVQAPPSVVAFAPGACAGMCITLWPSTQGRDTSLLSVPVGRLGHIACGTASDRPSQQSQVRPRPCAWEKDQA